VPKNVTLCQVAMKTHVAVNGCQHPAPDVVENAEVTSLVALVNIVGSVIEIHITVTRSANCCNGHL